VDSRTEDQDQTKNGLEMSGHGRFLTLFVFRDRSLTSIVLASRLFKARGTQISARTVRKVLHDSV
jgi:hypothetical protein